MVLVILNKGADRGLGPRPALELREEGGLEQRVVEGTAPAGRMPVDAAAELVDVPFLRAPEAAADEGGAAWLAVDVVAGVGAFAAGAGPCCREVRLSRVVSGTATKGVCGRLGTLYGVGSLLKRMSRCIRKMTSLVGSSGMVSSTSVRVWVVVTTNESQSLSALLYSPSCANSRSARCHPFKSIRAVAGEAHT